MRRRAWMGAVLLALVGGWAVGGEPAVSCFLERVGPAGGWCPYGGGLLCWWDRHCFPRCGCPDDYCRKNLPAVCWPPYPPYYICGTPLAGHPGPADVRPEPVGSPAAGEGARKPEPKTP
jgi:hypothetical protein